MSRVLRALLAAALASTVLVTTGAAVRADTSSNIPGIPLPNPVVTGQLGGPIYDVVYRLTVPPGYVIVAGLTGTPGTLFGLYLFDASATSVTGNQGLVDQSTVVGASQHISYPTRIGGIYYLDLNGATNVEGTYTLSVQIVPDPTPPVVQVVLDGGAKVTNDPKVTATILAYDDLSGVVDVSLSADGTNFGPWIPYTGQATWTFSGADGTKTLWVRAMNGVGLASAPVSASIVLDRTAPTVVQVSPPDGATVGLRPTITVRFDKPIDPATWTASGLVLQSSTGAIVPGTLSYDAARTTGVFTPGQDLQPGVTYLATLGQVRDPAGNRVAAMGSWVLHPLLPTSLTLATPTRVIEYGERVALTGTADIPAGAAVSLEQRPQQPGAAEYTQLRSLTPAGGEIGAVVTPAQTTWYRVTYAGSESTAPASAQARVIVRRQAAIVEPAGSGVHSAIAGQAIVVTARATPAAAGLTVSFRLYRCVSPTSCRYAGSYGRRTYADGTASIRWTPQPGRWQWRAVVYQTVEFAAGVSPAATWSVAAR